MTKKYQKKAKWITLAVTIVCLAVVGSSVYFFMREDGSEMTQRLDTTQVEKADISAAAPESATSVENEESTNISDNLILISGGTFSMGSPKTERQRQEDETQHDVTVSSFYIDPYEVTQADYETIMGENPSHFRGDNLPVESVTWYDAVKYCNALSKNRGLTPVYTVEGDTVRWDRSANGYRLLTEAEWEYAARANTTTVFHDGNQITSDNANFEGSYPYLIEENYVSRHDSSVVTSRNRGETIAVDSLSPNGFGIYNMYGNVSEWCFDYYGEYDTAQTTDPVGAASGSLRINRGGGYNDFAKQLRSAYRSATTPDTMEQNMGFRIARNAEMGDGVVETKYLRNIQTGENPRILVAYFSYSGNTENGAQIIADMTGGDLFEIQMENPYNGNIYEISQEDLNDNVHPALASHVENMEQYDIIILGYPTWWSTMPMPVYTFLEEYDFSGKVILPFSSNGGTRFGDSVSDLSKTAAGSYVGQGFEYEYSGGSGLSSNLNEWLDSNGIEAR